MRNTFISFLSFFCMAGVFCCVIVDALVRLNEPSLMHFLPVLERSVMPAVVMCWAGCSVLAVIYNKLIGFSEEAADTND